MKAKQIVVEGVLVNAYAFLAELLPDIAREDDKLVRLEFARQGLEALEVLGEDE